MRVVESKAATREEAIQSALEDLGVEMYEVDNIEILDEGSKGFLGFGARPVHVKLTVENLPDKPRHAQDRPKQERQKQERPRNERPRGNRQRNDRQRTDRKQDERKQEDRKREDRPRNERQSNERKQGDRPRNERQRNDRQRNDRPRDERKQDERPRNERQRNDRPRNERNAPQRDDQAAKPVEKQERKPQVRNEAPAPAPAPAPKEEQKQPKSSRGRGSRRRKEMAPSEEAQTPRETVAETPARAPRETVAESPARAPRPEVKEAAPAPRKERVPEEVNFDPISDEQGKEAAALLQEIIGKMEIEATVEFVRAEDDTARLNVTSEDNAILIGRKGRNLSAMQYLINRVIARGDVAENTERLVVDAEGYIDRRRESLEDLALSMASRAKEACRNFRLKPMSPQERRIIHVALQDDPDVRTYSLGDTLYRCVVISPSNAKPERGNSRRGGRGRGGRDRNEGRERHNPHGHDGDIDAGTFGD